LENIDNYVKRRPVEKLGFALMDEPYLQFEPFGVVLIIGAWNYPVQLLVIQLVAAIAAGNCVIIKPSEVVPNTEQLLTELIPQYLNKVC
jgi:acyl-CoA reductase-like NAD-dependent aldehyde dehydrogenase